MKTQIIKLDSLKVNLKETFNKLIKKYSQKNAEITLIVKQSDIPNSTDRELESPEQNNIHSSRSKHPYDSNHIKSNNRYKDRRCQYNKEKIKEVEDEDSEMSVQICVSNHDVMPNVTISSYSKQKVKDGFRKRRVSIDAMNLSIWPATSGPEISLINKQNYSQRPQNKERQKLDQNIPSINIPATERSNDQSSLQVPQSRDKILRHSQDRPTILNPNEDENSQDHADSVDYKQSQQSLVESLFIIENKLNDAIKFIENNQIFQLEEYLYEFKTKYKNISQRIQIKWRLLMAHCKQSRKEYQRASILYSQVLELAVISPKALLIDSADINHKLGICYMEIKRWNDGIMAFVKALNEMKNKGKAQKYAECMNNLGTLYLYAGNVEQAQKCFLVSYEIKKQENPSKLKSIVSSLFNLFECNIFAHNYEQAQQVLKIVEKFSIQIKDSQMIVGAINRRRGKLQFLKGDLKNADVYYEKAYEKLSQKYPYCLELGQLMNNIGILHLEKEQFGDARRLFNHSVLILNLYYTKDSIYIQMIKKNIQLTNSLENRLKNPTKTFNQMSQDERLTINLNQGDILGYSCA